MVRFEALELDVSSPQEKNPVLTPICWADRGRLCPSNVCLVISCFKLRLCVIDYLFRVPWPLEIGARGSGGRPPQNFEI
jgi:hypothetical protein